MRWQDRRQLGYSSRRVFQSGARQAREGSFEKNRREARGVGGPGDWVRNGEAKDRSIRVLMGAHKRPVTYETHFTGYNIA